MDQTPLVMDEIEAGASLIRDLQQHAPIKVAFWLKRDEDDERHLYLSSDRFRSPARPKFYEEVLRIVEKMQSIFLDLDRVILVPSDNQWALAAEQLNDRYADRLGTQLRLTNLGDRYIADAYIYPSPSIMSPTFPR